MYNKMNSFLREISLSEARRHFSSLLREIEANPDVGYRILVRKRVVAELRSPQPAKGRMNAGAALLKLADEIARRRRPQRTKGPEVTSQNYKEFLYGKHGVLGPRSGR